ncbi:MAG: PepSY domain-containing protein [Thermoproteota archaeon]|nr:PepSY domain-containing protein [Thermoproteota archaeon]
MDLKIVKITMIFTLVMAVSTVFATPMSLYAQTPANVTSAMPANASEMMPTKNNSFMDSSLKGDENKDRLTSSVSIFQPLINSFKSVINVSINDAITTAQDSVGENSTTIAAFLHPERQYIVYNVFTLDSSGTIHKILIDPGNGNVLDDQQMSFMDLMAIFHGNGAGDHDKMMGPGMGMGMMDHDKMMGPGMGMGMKNYDEKPSSWSK